MSFFPRPTEPSQQIVVETNTRRTMLFGDVPCCSLPRGPFGVQGHAPDCINIRIATGQPPAQSGVNAPEQIRQRSDEANVVWARRIASPKWPDGADYWLGEGMYGHHMELLNLAKDFLSVMQTFELKLEELVEVFISPATADDLMLGEDKSEDAPAASELYGLPLSFSELVPDNRVMLYDGALFYGERTKQ